MPFFGENRSSDSSAVRRGRPEKPLLRGRWKCGGLQWGEMAHFHPICTPSQRNHEMEHDLGRSRHLLAALAAEQAVLVSPVQR